MEKEIKSAYLKRTQKNYSLSLKLQIVQEYAKNTGTKAPAKRYKN